MGKSNSSGLRDFQRGAMRRADYIRETADPAATLELTVALLRLTQGKQAASVGVAGVAMLLSAIRQLHDDKYEQTLDVAAIGVLLQETLDRIRTKKPPDDTGVG